MDGAPTGSFICQIFNNIGGLYEIWLNGIEVSITPHNVEYTPQTAFTSFKLHMSVQTKFLSPSRIFQKKSPNTCRSCQIC